MAEIRILIVDDHPVVREGLAGMLAGQPDFEVAGEAGDGAEAVALAETLHPDVILMDLRMPGVDGVNAIRQLKARRVPARVLVLTTYDSEADIVAAVEAGATGYLLKDAPREDLYRGIRAAAAGETFLAPVIASRLLNRLRRVPAEESLSAREIEVLERVSQGASNREIARALHISEATVKTHLIHIYEKLAVSDRTSAVMVALERGILRRA
jgi:DNA-binding NarL/FixJ family response regulator